MQLHQHFDRAERAVIAYVRLSCCVAGLRFRPNQAIPVVFLNSAPSTSYTYMFVFPGYRSFNELVKTQIFGITPMGHKILPKKYLDP